MIRQKLMTPVHISWVLVAFVTVMLLAVGYHAAATIDRQAADIVDLTAELDRLERYVPAYAACREAADTGHALGWAWHDWVGEQTQPRVDRVEDLQRIQGEQLEACGLTPVMSSAEAVVQ